MLLTSSWFLDALIFSTSVLILLYKYFTRNFDYWKKRKIFYPKPVPLLGNFSDVATFKITIQELLKTFWDQTDDAYFGIFIFDEPVLVLKSPELIKDVLIRDFSIFCDRRVAKPKHPYVAYSVFNQEYASWKKVRTKLSPLFTSGMLKYMHSHIEHINQLTTNFLRANVGIIDARLIGGHFSTEMIVRCFYGADPHCFDQETSLFRQYIHKLFDFNFRNAIIQNLFFIKPSWVSALKLNFIEAGAIEFFKNAFKDAMDARVSYDGKPQNFSDLANKGCKEKMEGKPDVLDFEMAVSNAILFLIAGQETTSTIIAFTMYELAMNRKVQDKLREEIKANFEKYGGFSYEGVQDNKYLEMCINETMRLYPAIPFLDRKPIVDYQFRGTDLIVEKGMSVLIPFFALHREEKYYPNPNTYNPERFLDDTTNPDGLYFIPFGEGPRACIGKRLGILALLMALSNIVLQFRIETCETTPEKIEFDPKNFALVSKVGLPLKITPIEERSS